MEKVISAEGEISSDFDSEVDEEGGGDAEGAGGIPPTLTSSSNRRVFAPDSPRR